MSVNNFLKKIRSSSIRDKVQIPELVIMGWNKQDIKRSSSSEDY